MIKNIAAFLVAFLVIIFIAGASIFCSPRPVSSVWMITMGLLLTIVFSWSTSYTGFNQRLILAGLICGAVLVTLLIVFFDWALGMAPTAELSASSFRRYITLALNPSSILGIATPLIVTITGFFSGRGLFLVLHRWAQHDPS
jgi:hypothetical protein